MTESFIDECNYYTTELIFDIYLRMFRCFVDGTPITTDTFCGYTYEPSKSPITYEPTKSPIPSTPPTLYPTQMPSTPSMAPIVNTADLFGSDDGIGGYNVLICAIVVICTFVSVFVV